MTDLKNLLDEAAGSEPVVTPAEVAAVLTRGRRAVRRRRHTRIGITAGIAAVMVAALAVPLVLSPGSTASAPPAAGSAEATTASQLLLVAAAQEERSQPTAGKYFRVRTVQSIEWTIRPGKVVCCEAEPPGPGGYKLRELRVSETWTGLKGGTAWIGVRSLGAHPATAADEAIWRREGSPTSWNIISTKPGNATFFELKDGADRYLAVSINATLQDVLALPTTPAELRSRLLKVKVGTPPDAAEASLVQILASVLSETPAPPKVRGAAFRLLAGLSGATIKPDVKDLAGRIGTAVAFSFPAYQLDLQLIIDPKTGRLLSSAHSGGKSGDNTVLLSSWTNETPQAPPTSIK